jgi:hypothetical protein
LTASAAAARPGDVLVHPLSLGATALYGFNDWWLKAHHPGLLSGKLSDVAGMIVLPLTMLAVAELASGRVLGWRAAAGCAGITVVGFGAVEVWPLAEQAWCWTWGAMQWPFRAAFALLTGHPAPPLLPVLAWSDPTDLLTAPFAALALVPRAGSRPAAPAGGGRSEAPPGQASGEQVTLT